MACDVSPVAMLRCTSISRTCFVGNSITVSLVVKPVCPILHILHKTKNVLKKRCLDAANSLLTVGMDSSPQLTNFVHFPQN